MDLFEGLDGLSSSSQKKQSLAEQLESKKKTTQNAFDNLDFLGQPSINTKPPIKQPVQSNDDDLFGIFTSAPPPKQTNTQNASNINAQASNVPPKAANNIPKPTAPTAAPAPAPAPLKSDYTSDRKLAQLVDMGFEPKDARRALNAMNNDVRGAVSWLMAESQGMPLPRPRKQTDFSDLQSAASMISSSVFSKASSLFNKGKKELEKAYNQYQSTGFSDRKPAWMNEQVGRERSGIERRERRESERERSERERSGIERSEIPSRSERSEIPRSDRSEPSSLGSISAEPSRSRPSRAELFRQQQQKRKESPSPATHVPPPAKPVEIDLLNLNEQTPQTSLSQTETDLYSTSRQLGSEAYKLGNYEEAANHYTSALQIVVDKSLLRALLLSNRSAAYLKAGNTSGAFNDTLEGIQIIPNNGLNQQVEGKNMQDIWMKLVLRNAQSAETMEKFDAALKSYQLLLDNGFASANVLEAKRRCLKASNPEAQRQADQQRSEKRSNRRGWGTQGVQPTSAEGKAALQKVKTQHEKLAKEEKERDMLRDKVSNRVDSWKLNNENNLRVLLSTLQNVLWAESNWQPVASSDLVVPRKVRVVYMKAVAKTHPDKIPANSTTEVKMIAQSVFVVIQSAWEKFKVENGM